MNRKGREIPRLPLAVAWSALIIAVSSIPSLPRQIPPLFHYDKIFHLIEYGVFAWLWGEALRRSAPGFVRRHAWAIVLAGGFLFAAGDELYQGTVGRSCDPGDWLADAVGITLAEVVRTRRGKKREG